MRGSRVTTDADPCPRAPTRIYSRRPQFDTVDLTCGSTSDSVLYDELKRVHQDGHILGDAYAPRRLVFATRQAYALSGLLVRNQAVPAL